MSPPFARSRRRDRLLHVCAATLSRHRKEGYGRRAGQVKRCAFRRFSRLISRRMRLRWRSRCDMRVGDRTRLLTGLECLCVHCGFHTLSNLFMLCDAQFFSITLSAVCLETATDELAGVAQPPHSHWVRARVVSTASFWGCVCGRSACLQCGTAARAWAVRRDGRQSGSRDRERTWGGLGTEKFRIACIVQDLGDPALIVQPFSYYIHIVRDRSHEK